MNITKFIGIVGIVSLACIVACKEEETPLCEKTVDYNEDGYVTTADFGLFLSFHQASDSKADLNCDQKFDEIDLEIFQGFLGTSE
jgi:uncharacterized membrane protein